MRLLSTDFCALMVLGVGLICNGDSRSVRVIDRSCDLKKIELPAEWRAQCIVTRNGKQYLRRDVDYMTRTACQRLLSNERILAQRKCIGK